MGQSPSHRVTFKNTKRKARGGLGQRIGYFRRVKDRGLISGLTHNVRFLLVASQTFKHFQSKKSEVYIESQRRFINLDSCKPFQEYC